MLLALLKLHLLVSTFFFGSDLQVIRRDRTFDEDDGPRFFVGVVGQSPAFRDFIKPGREHITHIAIDRHERDLEEQVQGMLPGGAHTGYGISRAWKFVSSFCPHT